MPQENAQNQLILADRGSQGLNHQPESKNEGDLGPQNIFKTCVVWSSDGTPNSGTMDCPDFRTLSPYRLALSSLN